MTRRAQIVREQRFARGAALLGETPRSGEQDAIPAPANARRMRPYIFGQEGTG